ncbi:MAG: GNAT family N-acetyltransferase [Opitutaceae bacterium]|jgi:ribosomal protein S18 acetylase RimI-like enzyme
MKTDTLIIDEMRPSDVHDVCALWHSIPELNMSASFDSAERILYYLGRNPGLSSVARSDGRIVGAVLCGHDGRRGSFYHLGVLPDFRRGGIARRMVDRSISALNGIGIHTWFLFTHEKNLQAQSFWRKTGWQHCTWVQYHYREAEKH